MTMIRAPRSIALRMAGTVAGAALLAACAIGPAYQRPPAPTPAAYKELGAEAGPWKTAAPADEIPRGAWWTLFKDDALNRLEDQANGSNQNIAAAAANLRAARAAVVQARAQLFPSLTADPAMTRERSVSPLSSHSLTYSSYALPLEASWEPDLWGRVGKSVKFSIFAAQAGAADLENVRLSQQAQLAAFYFQLRAQDEQRRLLDATVRAYRESLDLVRAQQQGGAGSDEAVAQAEAQLKAAEAQAASLGVLRAQYEHAIAVLCGQPPAAVSIPVKAFRSNPPRVPAGLPSALLERRPDIASAERRMAEANAQVGVAKTAFFPNLTLGASGGFQAFSMAKWIAMPSLVWALGPALAETLFDAGAHKGALHQAKAGYDQTVANYRQTVLTAFEQVEDNLSSQRILTQTIARQEEAVKAAQTQLDEADARYKAGLDPYLNVLTAQTALLASQQADVTFRLQRMVSSVQLIQALGGGWSAAQLPPEKDIDGHSGKLMQAAGK
jgi:NodT family efflux transporter outer membrane factor (OMF) lipoprotein